MLIVTLQVVLETRKELDAFRAKMVETLPNHEYTIGVEGWERCRECNREYAYPHLCNTHMLCGCCHPPIDRKST